MRLIRRNHYWWRFVTEMVVGVLLLGSIVLAQEDKDNAIVSKEIIEEIGRDIQQIKAGNHREKIIAQKEFSRIVKNTEAPLAGELRKYIHDDNDEIRPLIERYLEYIKYPSLKEYWEIFNIFDMLDMPNVNGKKLVLYNTGEYGSYENEVWFDYVLGWLISESPQSVTLFEEGSLITREYQRVYDLPKNWDEVEKEKCLNEKALPGYYTDIDFKDRCTKFLDDENKNSIFNNMSCALKAAIYGYWAFQHQDEEIAQKLLDVAKRYHGYNIKKPVIKPSFTEFIIIDMCTHIRWQAIYLANKGLSRSRLIDKWKQVEFLADYETIELTDNQGKILKDKKLTKKEFEVFFKLIKAREMIDFYKKMLEEDREWVEPQEEEINGMSASQKAEYWIYHLRDLPGLQMSDPGECSVFFTWPMIKEEKQAAIQLMKLGWDAIPVLISHLDDKRPTRCMGDGRSWMYSSYYILRYSGCCRQILERITGVKFYDKEMAEKWWDKYKEQGAEEYYMRLVRSGNDIEQRCATECLIQINENNYIPTLVEMIERESPAKKFGVFEVVVFKLGKQYQGFLETCLTSENLNVVALAALVLWRKCDSDVGAREVINRLRDITDKQQVGDYFLWRVRELFKDIRKDFVIEAMCEFLNHKVSQIRYEIIQDISEFIDVRVIEALIPLLDDKEYTGWHGSYAIRYCDLAAESICKLIKYSSKYPRIDDEADRDSFISNLREYLQKYEHNR